MQNKKEWKLRKLEEMLACSEDLPQYPSVETIGFMLQECRKEKNAVLTRRLCDYVQKLGLETHPSVANYLVPILADSGNLGHAQKLLHSLDSPNEYSWNSLIACFVRYGDPQKAFLLYQEMCTSSTKPSGYTFVALLKACASLKDVDRGKRLHLDIISSNLERQLFVGSSLVDMYGKCGLLREAQEVFDELCERDSVSWNALISGYFTYGLLEEAMDCFNQMELEGVAPTTVTFVFILQLCGSLMDLCKAQQLHANMVQDCLFERFPDISNALIDMYANCGFIAEAEDIFNELPSRDTLSWAALIGGYSKHKLDSEVIHCFRKLCSEGIVPNVSILICSLKACGNVGDGKKAEEIYNVIHREGLLDENDIVGTAVVDMYMGCGMLEKAHEVFERLSFHDVVSWTALILGYSKHGLCERALELFKAMQLSGVSPDTFCWNALIEGFAKHGHCAEALDCFERMQSDGTSPDFLSFVFGLQACGTKEDAKKEAHEIHSAIEMRGFVEKDIIVGNALVDFYANCGMILEAQHVFDELPAQDVVSWTALLGGYANHGFGEKALNLFSQMRSAGIAASVVTFVCVVKACGMAREREVGQEAHSEIEKQGLFRHELCVGNALIGMYADCGMLDEARQVFDALPTRDIVSWTSVIAGYAMHGYDRTAAKCFEHMKSGGVSPDAVLWSALIAGYAKQSMGEEALVCLDLMKADGIPPDVVTYASSLKAMGAVRLIEKGREMHAEITGKGFFGSDVVVGNALVDLYATCGLLKEARCVFDGLPASDAISWTTLIAGYTKHGYGEEALDCFERMKKDGSSPDAVTYVYILKACATMGAAERGEAIHREIAARGPIGRDHLAIANAAIDMYSSFGLVKKAQDVFDRIPDARNDDAFDRCLDDAQVGRVSPNVASWNALMAGYAHRGDSGRVFRALDRMLAEDLSPNAETLISVLTACSHEGLVGASRACLECMSNEYGIDPSIEHYACVIDSFARMGQLGNAVAAIRSMPYHPNLVVWHTVLGACRKRGDVEIGRWAFSHALQLDEGDAGAYVSLYNIHADDARIREHAERLECGVG